MCLDHTTKTCSKCGETKPETTKYFYRYRDRKGALKFKPTCKDCRARYRARNKEKIVQNAREYYETNKKRISEQRRGFRAAHPELIKQRDRANGIKFSARKKERYRAWKAANPHALRLYKLQYRARKRNAEGTHTAEDIRNQYKAQKGKCYYCATKVGDTYHVDHVIPLSRGGSNWPENLVIACASCNSSKQDKLPHEWVEGGRLL